MLFYVLAIESSCDNSSLCLIDSEKRVLFYRNINQNIMLLQHGGYIPKLMIKKHMENFYKIVNEFCKTNLIKIDYIAVCCGPGIIMSLSIGYALAHVLSYRLKAQLVYIDHIEAHLWSHLIDNKISMHEGMISSVISGGHCLTAYIKFWESFNVLSNCVDDAPGEILDKIAIKLNIYPPHGGGIERYAKHGKLIYELLNIRRGRPRDINKFYPVSFSGLKTRTINYINNISDLTLEKKYDIACSIQEMIFIEIKNVLCYALSQSPKPNYLAFSGGVISNMFLRKRIRECFKNHTIYFSKLEYSCDNAVMIANIAIMCIMHGKESSYCCYSKQIYNKFFFNIK